MNVTADETTVSRLKMTSTTISSLSLSSNQSQSPMSRKIPKETVTMIYHSGLYVSIHFKKSHIEERGDLSDLLAARSFSFAERIASAVPVTTFFVLSLLWNGIHEVEYIILS